MVEKSLHVNETYADILQNLISNNGRTIKLGRKPVGNQGMRRFYQRKETAENKLSAYL